MGAYRARAGSRTILDPIGWDPRGKGVQRCSETIMDSDFPLGSYMCVLCEIAAVQHNIAVAPAIARVNAERSILKSRSEVDAADVGSLWCRVGRRGLGKSDSRSCVSARSERRKWASRRVRTLRAGIRSTVDSFRGAMHAQMKDGFAWTTR